MDFSLDVSSAVSGRPSDFMRDFDADAVKGLQESRQVLGVARTPAETKAQAVAIVKRAVEGENADLVIRWRHDEFEPLKATYREGEEGWTQLTQENAKKFNAPIAKAIWTHLTGIVLDYGVFSKNHYWIMAWKAKNKQQVTWAAYISSKTLSQKGLHSKLPIALADECHAALKAGAESSMSRVVLSNDLEFRDGMHELCFTKGHLFVAGGKEDRNKINEEISQILNAMAAGAKAKKPAKITSSMIPSFVKDE
ncbi:Nc [Tulasnella bunyavirales-like virus 1]|uniref:Nc n=1 Tax=Tulasnella bunyavirales-like virus 1 TaxID=3071304 RepID=A0A974MZC5_9VIRU|nr:Nc [Tulasnella bunyavirales-like virus 1]QPB44677.1 Nc [Tulasnella bunyavirales-like virus 1]